MLLLLSLAHQAVQLVEIQQLTTDRIQLCVALPVNHLTAGLQEQQQDVSTFVLQEIIL